MFSLAKTAAETTATQVVNDNGPENATGGGADYAAGVAAHAPKPVGERAQVIQYHPGRGSSVSMVLSKGERAGVQRGMLVEMEVAGCRLVGRIDQVFAFRSTVRFSVGQARGGKFHRRANNLLSRGRKDVLFLPLDGGAVTGANTLADHLQARAEAKPETAKPETVEPEIAKPETEGAGESSRSTAAEVAEEADASDEGAAAEVLDVTCARVIKGSGEGRGDTVTFRATLDVETSRGMRSVLVSGRSKWSLMGEVSKAMRDEGFKDKETVAMAKGALRRAIHQSTKSHR